MKEPRDIMLFFDRWRARRFPAAALVLLLPLHACQRPESDDADIAATDQSEVTVRIGAETMSIRLSVLAASCHNDVPDQVVPILVIVELQRTKGRADLSKSALVDSLVMHFRKKGRYSRLPGALAQYTALPDDSLHVRRIAVGPPCEKEPAELRLELFAHLEDGTAIRLSVPSVRVENGFSSSP